MCGPSVLRPEVKEGISAWSVERHAVSSSPFGSDDEIGMLNLITPEISASMLSRADAGRVFDLSVDLFPGMPTWTKGGEPPYQIWMNHTPAGSAVDDPVGVGREQNELVAWSADSISMFTHCGTHIDTLNHFGYHDRIWNNFNTREHLGSTGWTVAGADKLPPLIARGVLLDVARALDVDVLPDSFVIGAEELEMTVSRQGTQIQVGDVVMVRTGRGATWSDPEKYLPREPGIDRAGAIWLAKRGAAMVGADNIALERLPSSDPENWLPAHTYLLAEAGVPIMEVMDLEEIAEEELYESCYLGASLKLRGATAGPVRPLAFPLTD
ncbi:MAG: cyclase family protein [Acidimicrobiia bacterium]|nr:cyclase family protein [Acidimicrobiia bacterium]